MVKNNSFKEVNIDPELAVKLAARRAVSESENMTIDSIITVTNFNQDEYPEAYDYRLSVIPEEDSRCNSLFSNQSPSDFLSPDSISDSDSLKEFESNEKIVAAEEEIEVEDLIKELTVIQSRITRDIEELGYKSSNNPTALASRFFNNPANQRPIIIGEVLKSKI